MQLFANRILMLKSSQRAQTSANPPCGHLLLEIAIFVFDPESWWPWPLTVLCLYVEFGEIWYRRFATTKASTRRESWPLRWDCWLWKNSADVWINWQLEYHFLWDVPKGKSSVGVLGEGSHHFWAATGCGRQCKFSQWVLGRSRPPNGFSLYLNCNYFYCTVSYTKWRTRIKCLTVTQLCYAFYTLAVTYLRGYALAHFIPNHVPRFVNSGSECKKWPKLRQK